MTSVRLGSALEEQLGKAAEATGETPSEFIRRAVQRRIDDIERRSAREALAPYLGVVASPAGSNARESGREFTRIVASGGGAR